MLSAPGKAVLTEEAVSPVIGVILMVAITVILAAVIAAFVFGLAGTTTTAKTVGINIQKNSTDSKALNIMFTGGADLPSLTEFTVNQNGATATGISVAPSANYTATSGVVKLQSGTNSFVTGNIIYIMGFTNDVSGSRITIIGKFKDGSDSILWDRTL